MCDISLLGKDKLLRLEVVPACLSSDSWKEQSELACGGGLSGSHLMVCLHFLQGYAAFSCIALADKNEITLRCCMHCLPDFLRSSSLHQSVLLDLCVESIW